VAVDMSALALPAESETAAPPAVLDPTGIIDACKAALPAVLLDPAQPRLVFQPLVDLRKGAIAGYEALARFDGPVQATPDRWFAAAAVAGLGPALESRVIKAALAARNNMPPNCFLTVNVSPHALTTAPVMDEFLRGGELAGVFVEITEEQAITDPVAMSRELARLRDRGAMIALDDAGSGYSGLQRLLALRPDLMKLDRSLVAGIDGDEAKRACVEMLGVLATRLGSLMLAEGIERIEELRTIISLGVPLAQGYLLGRPAAPWAPLGAQTTAQIRVAARAASEQSQISALLEPARLVGPGDADVAIDIADAHPGSAAGAEPIAVLLDDDGRAVALAITDDAGESRTVDVSLRLSVATSIPDAARECLTRPSRQRFDPLLCTHDDGTVAGVVRMERLIDWLGRQ